MSSLSKPYNALPKRGLPKGADAEDGSWRRTDLADGNKIPLVVAAMRRAIISYVNDLFNVLAYYVIAVNSAIIFLWMLKQN